MNHPKTTYLRDYQPSDYTIEQCSLEFIIDTNSTRVENVMEIRRQNPHAKTLRLDGEQLDLELIWLNDRLLSEHEYVMVDDGLLLPLDEDTARIRIMNRIYPDENTALEGLYRSGGIWCTQNEPHGFRRITYFIDRPDVMTRFTTKIIANTTLAPVLLSNGNLIGTATLDNGKHVAIWEDPIPKPCYLFALVAGDLGSIHDTFTTMSGKHVDLAIYCDHGNEAQCHYAMHSLKKAMEWDEVMYGREYDLSVYNIVAVESFNMGAMENKGLNIFNAHYVLADETRATDADFMGIESVIAHEYFHNWTGNRITCRNWFELTLKEGLTVFRDQCFSADQNSPLIQRIDDVRSLRQRQFVEDAGPTAHPIKPDHFIEINNFYTATVYEKGAEVIRMLHTLLGEEKFRRAMDTYFETFDGQAVGTEDFLGAMQTQSPIDLTQFKRWYFQERTPTLHVSSVYDATKQTVTLTLEQKIPLNTRGEAQLPYAFPLSLALLSDTGEELPLVTQSTLLNGSTLWVTEALSSSVFENITVPVKLSLNRDFGVPLIIECTQLDYPFLMANDSDGFNRYEASQAFGIQTIEKMMHGEAIDPHFVHAYGKIIEDTCLEPLFKGELLVLPTLETLMQRQEILNPQAIHSATESLKKHLAEVFQASIKGQFETLYDPKNSAIDSVSMGKRALTHRYLGLLMSLEEESIALMCRDLYYESKSMTTRLVALGLLDQYAPHLCGEALDDFYQRYANETLVMTKYFALCAASAREGTLQRVKALQEDRVFDPKIPNLVRALYGTFARNSVAFYDDLGEGFAFMADKVIELDGLNPQIASGLAGAFKHYRRLTPHQKGLMGKELQRIKSHPTISNNVYEIIEKIQGV